MRLTFPTLLPKTTPPIPSIPSSSTSSSKALSQSLSWLQTLKSKDLQHIARKTGLPCTGTKPVLLRGLESGLEPYLSQQRDHWDGSQGVLSPPRGKEDRRMVGKGEGEGMSILSIDMGIRNLAFAHLRCRESFLSSSGSFSARGGGHGHGYGDGDGGGKLVLNTWRRISLPLTRGFSITEFENYLDSPLPPQIVSKTCSQSQSSDRESKRETKLDSNIASDTDTDTELGNEGKKESKPPFSLPIYAQHAHSIISTLLSRYNPTHILIERQRFRSGGGSAVQEWSLRVGVFEGMVWAVLHTLRVQQLQERQQLSAGFGMGVGFYGGPRVFSIEPGRIGRYLISSGSSTTTTSFPDVSGDVDGTGTGKKRTTRSSREGKKLKIDLVGSWLENGLFEISADSDGVQPWVDEYLAKWKKEKKNKKDKKPAPNPKSKLKKISDLGTDNKGDVGARARVDIGKLDDLADCLIQGVTWLEWEGMKGRVGRDGVDAIRLDMS